MPVTRRELRAGILRVVGVVLPCVRAPGRDAKASRARGELDDDDDDDATSRDSRDDDGTRTESHRAEGERWTSSHSSSYASSSYSRSSSSRGGDDGTRERRRGRGWRDGENDDDDDDDDERSEFDDDDGSVASVASGISSSTSRTDSQATASDASAKDEEEDVLVGRSTVIDESVGDVSSTKVECGPDASEEALEEFMRAIQLCQGENVFGGGLRERDIFKRGLVRQVVYDEGEYVLKEGQAWDHEQRNSRSGGYSVYFVIRGACAATKLVHPRHPRVHTREALKFANDPMTILRPIPTQVAHLNADASDMSASVRQRALDMKRADQKSEVEVAKFIRGCYFGDYEVLKGRIPRRCSVRSLVKNTALAIMPGDVFERLCRRGTKLRERVEADHSLFI